MFVSMNKVGSLESTGFSKHGILFRNQIFGCGFEKKSVWSWKGPVNKRLNTVVTDELFRKLNKGECGLLYIVRGCRKLYSALSNQIVLFYRFIYKEKYIKKT